MNKAQSQIIGWGIGGGLLLGYLLPTNAQGLAACGIFGGLVGSVVATQPLIFEPKQRQPTLKELENQLEVYRRSESWSLEQDLAYQQQIEVKKNERQMQASRIR